MKILSIVLLFVSLCFSQGVKPLPFGASSLALKDTLLNIVIDTPIIYTKGMGSFSKFQSVITSIGSSSVRLVVDKQIPITANITLPANIVLDVVKVSGGNFLISAGDTLKIAGAFQAPDIQVFAGAGIAVFTNPQPPSPRVAWWGATGDSTQDATSAFQSALAVGGTLQLPLGNYKITQTLSLTNTGIVGTAAGVDSLAVRTLIKFYGLQNTPAIKTRVATTKTKLRLENIYVLANSWDPTLGCTSYGLDIEDPVSIKNVVVNAFKLSNVFFHNDAVGNGPFNSVIENLFSFYSGKHGILVGTGANNMTFLEAYTAYNGATGYGVTPSGSGSGDGFCVRQDSEGNPGNVYRAYTPEAIRVIGGNGFRNSRYGWNFTQTQSCFLEPGYAEANYGDGNDLHQIYLGNSFQSSYTNIDQVRDTAVTIKSSADRRNNTIWIRGKQYGYPASLGPEIWNIANRTVYFGENLAQNKQAFTFFDSANGILHVHYFGNGAGINIGNNDHFLAANNRYDSIYSNNNRLSIKSDSFFIQDTNGRVYTAGQIGIGQTPVTTASLVIGSNNLTTAAQFGLSNQPRFNKLATLEGIDYLSQFSTDSSQFRMTYGRGMVILGPQIKLGDTVDDFTAFGIAAVTGAGVNHAITTSKGSNIFGDTTRFDSLTVHKQKMLATAISAPGTPASGIGAVYQDVTNKVFSVKNDAGVVSHTAQTTAKVPRKFFDAFAGDGSYGADTIAASDLPGSFSGFGTPSASSVKLSSPAAGSAATSPRTDATFQIDSANLATAFTRLDSLARWKGSTTVTILGTVLTGTWNGTTIAIANGGTGQTTKAAAFDALSPMTAAGDILYGGTSGTGTRLASNSSATKMFLRTFSSGNPAWAQVDYGDLSGTPTVPTGATPTAKVGKTAVAGAVSSTYTRSDGSPALDTTLNWGWSGNHRFYDSVKVDSVLTLRAKILDTAITAPGTPGSGLATIYVDATSKNLCIKNDAGTVDHGVQTKAVIASIFFTGVNDAGVFSAAQPAFTDISGSVATSQMPAFTGDITTSAGAVATTLATVATAGTTGSSTAIPVITINVKGLTTSITTAAVIAPAGTLTGATLASGVTASSLTSLGTQAADLLFTDATYDIGKSAATRPRDIFLSRNLTIGGRAGFGALNTATYLNIGSAASGPTGTSQWIISATPLFDTTNTASAIGFDMTLTGAAANGAYVTANSFDFLARNPVNGTNQTRTNAYGYYCSAITRGTALNYAFFSAGAGLIGISDVTDATSITTGSLQTLGGVGITKALWVGGLENIAGVLTAANTTDATSITTGGIVASGGIGATKALWIGGLANIAGIATLANTTDASSSTVGGTVVSGGIAVAKKANIGTVLTVGTSINTTNLLISTAAPTVSSGFGTGASITKNNGTLSFLLQVGTGGTASSGVIGLPTASNGWSCFCNDRTTNSTAVANCKQTASSTTTATITNYSNLIVLTAWPASDTLGVMCSGY